MVYNDYDFDKYQKKLILMARKHNLISDVLGVVRNHNILLLRKQKFTSGPRVLIAAGFHGEEPAGPWCILKFLEVYGYPSDVNMAFLPMVNPTGFRLSRRADFYGRKPNSGYINTGGIDHLNINLSPEDKILKDSGNYLKIFAVDSTFTMHEDD